LIQNIIHIRNCTRLVVFFLAVVVASLIHLPEAHAQQQPKAKTESEKEIKRKEKKRKRFRGKKLRISKKKSKLLEKFYLGRRSRQIQKNPGILYLHEQAQRRDHDAMRERTERNPSRRNMKAFQSRKQNMRLTSKQLQKSYGGNPVTPKNKKLNYKFNSKVAQQSTGTFKRKDKQTKYRKKSRNAMRHAGNIVLKPEAMRRDHDAIRERVDRNPGKTNRQAQQQRESNYQRTSDAMKHQGNIKITQNQDKLTRKYSSETMQKFTGNLKVKSRKDAIKPGPSRAPGFSGDIPYLSKNQRKQALEGKSLNMSTYQGTQKGTSKGARDRWYKKLSSDQVFSGNLKGYSRDQKKQALEYQSNTVSGYQGRIKSHPKKSEKWYAKVSKYNMNYRGDFKAIPKKQQEQMMEGKSLNMSQYQGTRKAPSKDYGSRTTPMTLRYQGNIPTVTPKQRQQELQGKSLNMAAYQGNIKFNPKKDEAWFKLYSKEVAQHAGDQRGFTKKQKQQMLEGKSLNMASYQGTIKHNPKQKEKAYKLYSNKVTKYSGSLRGYTEQQKDQMMEAKSLNFSEYRGELDAKQHQRSLENRKAKSAMLAEYQGNIILKSAHEKEKTYEYESKTMHQYQGELNARKHQRSLEQRKAASAEMANFQGNIILRSIDNDELTYKYMSKVAHNYRGELKLINQKKKDKYYREMAARNQQVTGNYSLKYRYVRDLEHQYLSATVQNYQGGPKTSLFTRLILKIFNDEERLKKAENTDKKPRYDTREAEIWYD